MDAAKRPDAGALASCGSAGAMDDCLDQLHFWVPVTYPTAARRRGRSAVNVTL